MQKLKAPARIDFAGGWTDIPFLIKGEEGYVSNVAISPLVTLSGDSLDMAIYPRGIGISTSTSVKAVEMAKNRGGLEYFRNKKIQEIAEDLFKCENNGLDWAIGRQDMYSVVFGGFNCFKFTENSGERIPIQISKEYLEELEKGLLLFYSGVSRDAQTVVRQVYENFQKNESARNAVKKIGECGLSFTKNLEAGNIEECAKIMSANWENQKILAPASSNLELDEIYNFALNSGALGGKMCGAGGGGAFIFFARDKEKLSRELTQNFQKGRELPFSFEYRNIAEINL